MKSKNNLNTENKFNNLRFLLNIWYYNIKLSIILSIKVKILILKYFIKII
jgi:hypothetical protein